MILHPRYGLFFTRKCIQWIIMKFLNFFGSKITQRIEIQMFYIFNWAQALNANIETKRTLLNEENLGCEHCLNLQLYKFRSWFISIATTQDLFLEFLFWKWTHAVFKHIKSLAKTKVHAQSLVEFNMNEAHLNISHYKRKKHHHTRYNIFWRT